MTAVSYPTHSKFGMRIYNGQKGLVDVPGSTSILNNLDKQFLGFARAKEAAQCAWDDLGTLLPWYAAGKEKAFVNHVKGAATRKWGEASDIGTAVHELAEKLLKGQQLGNFHPDLRGFVEHTEKFIKEFEVEPVEIEATCWNETVGYAGTADLFAKVGGEVICADFKTGASGVWPEVALQLASYCHAEFLVDPDGERRPIPQTNGAAAISLRPDHYKVVPVRVDDEVFEIFKHLVQVSNWQRTVSKSVLGAAVEPGSSGDN